MSAATIGRHPKAYLWGTAESAAAIARFTAGKSFEDYRADRMLRSAVERKVGIIGEALSRLISIDPQLAAQIPDLPRIVALKERLIHDMQQSTINSPRTVFENMRQPIDVL